MSCLSNRLQYLFQCFKQDCTGQFPLSTIFRLYFGNVPDSVVFFFLNLFPI